ncbi:helix-turn-helix domain-containing protein [Ornithinimicrobium sp. CNJ-824]|uniref:helix-turn-helix domain-containing protein n=1 Tax=Ornithinimicrobium sp. CNJ-824 TaxID=1904966 RepID=UPI00095D615F|nr:helix-turn-helix domain-containing protein [Ornithinimicrobium sp. CNJ-824]OLT20137.1 helix-turn-helix domain-containing protein [Ornithinimicrobium sp. CNJ-824]
MSRHTSQAGTAPKRQFESLSQAAERTGLSTYTLRRRIADGRLPAYRSGSRIIRVDPDDVDKLLTRIPAVTRRG